MDVKTLSEVIANQGFPIALSILLIFRIDKFMQEIVVAQKDGYRQILENTKETHNTITNLNQQNREYYPLRFGEAKKELSGMIETSSNFIRSTNRPSSHSFIFPKTLLLLLRHPQQIMIFLNLSREDRSISIPVIS